MFYVFREVISTADIITAKIERKLDLISGVIHQVDVLFEDGCEHEVHVQILHSNTQLWPSNQTRSDGTPNTLTGNATVVSFREFYELKPGVTDLTLLVWGDGTVDDKHVVVQIGLLPKRVLQPLSFEELLAAATGVR